jgi:hypothetical protein
MCSRLPDRGVARRAVAATLVAAALAALSWAQPAVAADDADRLRVWDTRELLALAVAHEHGEGVPRDRLRAAALYCEAARAGDVEGLYALGWMYANGRGVDRSDAFAAGLFTQAARRGHAPARSALALVGGEGDRLPDCMRVDAPRPPEPLAGDVEEEDYVAALPPERRRFADLVARLAPRYAVDPKLALAVAAVESDFDPAARSPKDAQGLMQLIPETAARFAVRNPYDPQQNVRGGLAYLRWLLSYYRGRVDLAVAAYNAGERAVDRYRGVPPFPETRDYVRKIRARFRSDQHPYDPQLADASPVLAPLVSGRR